MKKFIAIIIGAGVIGVIGYYAHFYFVSNTVDEVLLENMESIAQAQRGSFVEVDFIHKGSGEARLIRDDLGHALVRLENFKVTNGPDLYVYLSKSENPKETIGEFINLGRLKGNQGNQNYEVQENVNIGEYKSVIIWCQRFSVLFSYALLN